MNIKDIVNTFRSHQLKYGLDGDPKQRELYKWELLTKQVGHPDTDAKNFTHEIYSLDLQNLCFGYQTTAYKNFAKYEPEDYRLAFKNLFDENVDLQQRIDNFISTCKTLWDNKIKKHFEHKTTAMCDERLISSFLTLRFPQKYTFYKNDVYMSLCKILGTKPLKRGQKMVHFYELLNKYVIPIVEEDKVLMNSINEELNKNNYILSTPLIAQTALWHYVSKNSGTQQTIEEQTNNTSMEYQTYIELLKESHNLVLTGAPGTGKTYMAQAIANEMGAVTRFVQFHPSYDYTDFVEGLRPIENSDGQMSFERKDGVFKAFCKEAAKNIEDSQKTQKELSEEKIFEKRYNELVDKIENGEVPKVSLKTGKEMDVVRISDNNNIILRTSGNTDGREYIVSFDRLANLSKSYPNIESLNSITNIYKAVTEIIGGCHSSSYWAVLKKVYEQDSPENTEVIPEVKRKPYVFIIDEINRGEASKIFGELFFAIDPGYRGKTENLVQTQYQNLVPKEDLFAEGFYVPENVYILATMNDIDRSVESMDFAMRRRFTWKEITPTDTQSMLDDLECAEKAKNTMNRLNKEIAETEGLGPAYMVGPSYFLKLSTNGGDFDKLWRMNISPLLKEYLRGFRKSDEIMDKFKKAFFDTSDELEQS